MDADSRQFGGNLGYEDVLGEKYVWNNMVPNGRHVQPGDLAILRENKLVLGMAWIDDVTTAPGKKVQRRCPGCSSTAFKSRKTLSPPFRCSACKEEFATPDSETIEVTIYEADYGRTWRPLDIPVPVLKILPHYLNNSGQQAIRPMHLEAIRSALSVEANLGPRWWKEDGGLRPVITGGHRLCLQKARIGQPQFRKHLLARYGSRCAITGPQPEEALEAAHLYRYAASPRHDLDGGLLLRRDLHTLLDRGLLVIDTATWTVQVAPRLHKYSELHALHGRPLSLRPEFRPDVSYLDLHLQIATESWHVRSA